MPPVFPWTCRAARSEVNRKNGEPDEGHSRPTLTFSAHRFAPRLISPRLISSGTPLLNFNPGRRSLLTSTRLPCAKSGTTSLGYSDVRNVHALCSLRVRIWASDSVSPYDATSEAKGVSLSHREAPGRSPRSLPSLLTSSLLGLGILILFPGITSGP